MARPTNDAFDKLFLSRTSRKAFLLIAAGSLFMMLCPPISCALGTLAFAGVVATRLNDIGWSRWHASWVTLLALFVRIIGAMSTPDGSGPAHPVLSGNAAMILFVLLLILGLWPGQKKDNAFGAPPPRWRDALRGGKWPLSVD